MTSYLHPQLRPDMPLLFRREDRRGVAEGEDGRCSQFPPQALSDRRESNGFVRPRLKINALGQNLRCTDSRIKKIKID